MNPVLEAMFRDRVVLGREPGERQPYHSGVSRAQAESLELICAREHPTMTLEVGLAYGTSALAILEGKGTGNPQDRHYAVDPFQSIDWNGLGVANIERAGFGERFVLREELDIHALPDLEREQLRVDFAFIDGYHTFDNTFLDTFYVDRMLNVGGIMVIHDHTFAGVYKAVRWLMTHRHYRPCVEYEIPRPVPQRVGAIGRAMIKRQVDRLRSGSVLARTSMAVLRKTGEWKNPSWYYYRPF